MCLRRHLITRNLIDIVEIISKKRYDILVLNTICNATEEQADGRRASTANEADAMIVIGGRAQFQHAETI